ncbi:MAG: hypothetical protein F2690_01530 [Actinobacteria bacterium]|uniref:Unannotated protein n=1 Tax=freshwater metagenome TaxID=449393 RepID=A0A6J7CB42_9ZZZZ|nr:hypothetical protein [Actinomycetota bacterium]MSX45470.1 hypothetical protein [Actinomycetota bacterium]MSX71482.1 hypothetical protein [Actinomycetota bacterium]MSY69236.1 hypothetical protein [Actinomycetota bacterium]MTA75441.1 hypothetical protein [Actinomycetota bacterium]
MATRSNGYRSRPDGSHVGKVGFYLVLIPATGFLIKMITMANIVGGGAWLGADGENYLSGVEGLLNQGYFSDKDVLSFWPAGYPILIWFLAKISLANSLWLLSIIQSLFYAYSSYFFLKQLRGTQLQPYMFLIGMALTFNPTLSLSSLAVGYESPIASCMLMIVGLILKSQRQNTNIELVKNISLVGLFSFLATFMQPRWILTSVVFAVMWALITQGKKAQAMVLIGVIAIMTIAPAILIQRNSQAIQKSVISTNLGVTMRLGAGESTSGGYSHSGLEVPCDPVPPAIVVEDNDLVKCVLSWYAANPVKTFHLAINKAWYFWSPWSGPLGNGTMARNPWLKIDPIINIAHTSPAGKDFVYKTFGKVVSFLWVLMCISLFFIGFFWLRSMKGMQSILAYLAFTPVVLSWLISIATIGDHRFRLPTMPLSLFLQVLGYFALIHKIKTKSFAVKNEVVDKKVRKHN